MLGVACAALGVVLVFRPFTSVSVLVLLVAIGMIVTGIATLSSADDRWQNAVGVAWIAVGVTVLAWPDVSVRTLAIVVGVALIVGGALDAVAGLRGTVDQRLAAVIGGVASAIFGVLALSWPDVTILVIAVVFGARLVLFGLRTAWSAFRDRHDDRSTSPDIGPPGRLRRFGHLLGAVVALLVALALAGLSSQLNAGKPVVDDFYTAPDDVPAEPGALLRIEEFTRTIPDSAEAWRILYTTTRGDGAPAVASALVVVPSAPSDTPRPVIALAHGTTGVERNCAPSVLDDPFAAGAFFALDEVIEQGWALVATDYIGLGTEGPHPYLIGEPTGRAVLDSVRAAKQIDELDLADQTVVWGHSQGGGAALWTGQMASTYAPDVNVVAVASLAPASDIVGLVGNLDQVTGGSLFAIYALWGYDGFYDDVSVGDYVRPAARTTFDGIAGRCLSEPSVLLSVIQSVTTGMSVFDGDIEGSAFANRLEENVPTGRIEVPLLIAQGEADSLVVLPLQDAYVADRCAAGQAIDYRTYPGLNHVPLVEADSPLIPELIDWINARLAGDPPTPNCP